MSHAIVGHSGTAVTGTPFPWFAPFSKHSNSGERNINISRNEHNKTFCASSTLLWYRHGTAVHTAGMRLLPHLPCDHAHFSKHTYHTQNNKNINITYSMFSLCTAVLYAAHCLPRAPGHSNVKNSAAAAVGSEETLARRVQNFSVQWFCMTGGTGIDAGICHH